jgi:hypothetical protein
VRARNQTAAVVGAGDFISAATAKKLAAFGSLFQLASIRIGLHDCRADRRLHPRSKASRRVRETRL